MTKLDAAMKGLYLLGMRWVGLDQNGYYKAYAEKPELVHDIISGSMLCHGCQDCLDITDSNERLNALYNDYLEGLPDDGCPWLVELLPWLQAHNIPIPEVE